MYAINQLQQQFFSTTMFLLDCSVKNNFKDIYNTLDQLFPGLGIKRKEFSLTDDSNPDKVFADWLKSKNGGAQMSLEKKREEALFYLKQSIKHFIDNYTVADSSSVNFLSRL